MIDPSAKSLAGKVAVVTGAGKNIGRRIAEHLAAIGANVVVNGRNDQGAVDETAAMLTRDYGVEAMPFLADVTDRAAVDRMASATMERFGRVDVVVSNAAHRNQVPFLEMTYPQWRNVLDVVLDGAFNMCQAFGKPMVEAGNGGSIVTLSGISNRVGTLNRAHVNAAKGGLEGLTRGLANEFAPHGINVNAVAPGMIDTARGDSAGTRPNLGQRGVPLNRMGDVNEIAGMIRFLCSPEGAYTTGQTIHINGGVYLT
jgi:3-oxoacyl-[acyl-carrier protein] reductase